MSLKTIFFGTPDFALPSLLACNEKSRLLAVVSQPDKPKGRGQKVEPTPVKSAAIKLGIKNIFQPASLKSPSPELDALLSLIKQESPDLFVVTAYGNLLPQQILNMPKIFCVNVHASVLPRWRGAAPIQRALEAGDHSSGVALQKMVLALDAGPILAQEEIQIDQSWGAQILSEMLAMLGGRVLASFLGNGAPTLAFPQNEAKVREAKKISKEEGLWKPSWTALDSFRRSRAFQIWPGLRFPFGGADDTKAELKSVGLLTLDQPNDAINCEIGCFVLHGRSKGAYLRCSIRAGEPGPFVKLSSLQVPGGPPSDAVRMLENPSSQFLDGLKA